MSDFLWTWDGLPHPLTGDEHFSDFQRTRIPPGADPRAQWRRAAPVVENLFREVVFELGAPSSLTAFVAPYKRANSYVGYAKYVPADVVRWRDPEHRAEMTRRARELAAAVRRAGGG